MYNYDRFYLSLYIYIELHTIFFIYKNIELHASFNNKTTWALFLKEWSNNISVI